MSATNFIFSQNFISNAVRNNYTIALIISEFHLNALTANNSDADIAAREVIFQTAHNNLVSADVSKDVTIGGRITDTASLKDQFTTIRTTELPLWQNMIAAVAPRRSAIFKGFFPNGVNTILQGRIDAKIEAVKTLAAATLANGSLNAVSALITTRYNALIAKRNAQLGKKSTISGLTGAQEAAIAAMCEAHFYDHGLMITKFTNNPSKIESFIDVANLYKQAHGSTYNGTVHGSKIKTALTHKFTASSTFTVTATQDCQVWVIDTAKNIVKPTGMFVPAGVPTIIKFPDAGNSAHRVVQIKNLTLNSATYTMVL